MGDLILKAASGGDLILQEDGGSAALTIDTSGDTTVSGDLNPGSGPANFVGMIAPFGKSSGTIDGWLYCDGSAVSRSTYSVLFGIISTTWGVGNGSTTFNIPDLEGAFLRGTGDNGSNYMAKDTGSGTRYPFSGPSVGSFENDQMQGHKHIVGGVYPVNFGYSAPGLGMNDQADASYSAGLGRYDSSNNATRTSDSPSTDGTNGGERAGDETRPFNAGIRYYIKY